MQVNLLQLGKATEEFIHFTEVEDSGPTAHD